MQNGVAEGVASDLTTTEYEWNCKGLSKNSSSWIWKDFFQGISHGNIILQEFQSALHMTWAVLELLNDLFTVVQVATVHKMDSNWLAFNGILKSFQVSFKSWYNNNGFIFVDFPLFY